MNRIQANLCLLCVTLCWSTEVIIFACIPGIVSPFATTCITSAAGSILLALCFFRRIIGELKRDAKRVILRCLLLGLMNGSYNVLYLYGLKFFDVSSGAFTLSMTAVILPVILLTMRQKVGVKTWVSAGMVLSGIILAVGNTASVGQFWGILMIGSGCIIRAFYIVLLNRFASENDPIVLSSFLSMTVGIVTAIIWLITDPGSFMQLPLQRDIIASLAIYSYFIVAFAQTLNIFAQKKSTPANATIIYSMEIVFSVIWGLVMPASMIDKTVLTPWIVAGVLFVVAGNIVEIIPSGREASDEA